MGSSAVLFSLIAVAVFFLGLWLGFRQGRAAKQNQLDQFAANERRLVDELTAVRSEMERVRAESAARAGFESLAAEREKTIGQLTAEREALRQDLQLRDASDRTQNARIKELETELRNERQNLQEKLALLEGAKQTLAHQFEALAADILEKKSKSFSEGSQKEMGTLLTPLRDQIKEFREKVEEAQTD